MNELIQRLQAWLGPNAKVLQGLAAPIMIVMILGMMVLPLPAFVLDVFFTFNIAMALMVMLVAAYMLRPLDFAAFPAVLLLTTLMRLSLNVASARVVLLQGHTGTGAAGRVIESFGHFLIGGNFAVGLIVFAILVVINFIVVTKGAERIAEVGARFTLDAMPGKQMAVDADLNAGLINEAEAKRRRAELGDEADFFNPDAKAAISKAFQDAPTKVKGSSVPRPSVTLVPSKNTVPGYSSSDSGVRRFGDGLRRGMPVSSNHIARRYPCMGTTVTFAGALKMAGSTVGPVVTTPRTFRPPRASRIAPMAFSCA